MARKNLLKKIIKFVTNDDYRFIVRSGLGDYDELTDEEFLRRKYKACLGEILNLDNPKNYNEKLQWLKLYDRNPKYTVMVDKYLVREYIRETIGQEYVIPLIGVWDTPDEIDFNMLPNQFVLKCNHNSGLGMCICKDKSKLDIEKTKRNLLKGLNQDYYITNREWPYKNVPRKIICEKYMTDSRGGKQIDIRSIKYEGLLDYKFYCFNGDPKFLYVSNCEFVDGKKHDYLDHFYLDWTRTPFQRIDHEKLRFDVEKPACFDEMISLSKKMTKGIPFVRVDWFVINNRPFFGEFTFFPGAGFANYSPNEWNTKIGEWIVLD